MNNAGTILGTTGAAILLRAGGSIYNSGSLAGGDSSASIVADAAATVTNATTGTITTGFQQIGIALVGGSTLDNRGLIQADNYGVTMSGTSGLIINSGTLGSCGCYYGVSLGGGELTNTSTGYIFGGVLVANSAGTVVNSGSIYSPLTYGIVAAQGGTVSNTGTITASYIGIRMPVAGYVYNGGSGSITGDVFGIAMTASGNGTITNYGTVRETSSTAFAAGIYVNGGGTVTNHGLVEGARFGVNIFGSNSSTIFNYGTITGGGGIGIYGPTADRTIINAGTIAGTFGAAVIFAGYGNSTLVLEQGYAISGAIVSAPGANSAIQLRGGATTPVTVNFNSLSLFAVPTVGFAPDASNYATLQITDNGALPGQITNFTGRHDTIDLTTLAYDTASSGTHFDTVTHQLTVTNQTTSVTLQLGAGDYSVTGWKVANDGSGGTDISPVQTDFLIHNESELNAAFAAISVGGIDAASNTVFTLTFANGLALNSAVNGVTLASGSSVTIDGAGFTLNGGGGAYGFINSTSPITINDLAIANGQAAISAGGHWTFTGSDTIGSTATLTNSGTLTTSGTLTDTGSLINNGSIAGAVTLAAGATLEMLPGATANGTIGFAAAGGRLLIDGANPPVSPSLVIGATIDGFAVGDTINFTGVAFDPNGKATLLSGNMLQVIEQGRTFDLQFDPSQSLSGFVFGLAPDGNGGTNIGLNNPLNPPAPPGSTTAMILRRASDGQYEIYNIGGNAILAGYKLGEVGTDWLFNSLGGVAGGNTTMLLRNAGSGGFELYGISNNIVTAAFLGAVGLDWQFAGFGNFASLGQSDMILRNGATGALQVYDIANFQITNSAALGTVGLNWQVGGFGNFSSRGTSDMIMRNTATGGLQVYDIDHNQITNSAFMGTVGLEWQISGVGNFSSRPGESDVIMRNTNTGGLQVYDIANNQITGSAFLGTVGLDWQFAGVAPVHGAGTSDLVLRNVSSGAFEAYNIANNQITGAASLGQVGLEWQLGGLAADPPTGPIGGANATSQLVQAMASFGAGSAGDISNTVPLGPETSQQPLLATPHA